MSSWYVLPLSCSVSPLSLPLLQIGNELSGSGIGASVGAEQYGKDLIKLKETVNELYKKSASKPSLIAPGGFFDQEWYTKLLQVSGPRVVNVVTHHIYNLGAGEQLWWYTFLIIDICTAEIW